MLNAIWVGMILVSFVVALFLGRLDLVVASVTESAKTAFQLALGLAGIMALWLGIMQIASGSGLVDWLARRLRPILRPLFPDVPPDDKAMGAIVLNFSANMLGLGNAATPFGLQAMKELQRLNQNKSEASDAMCTFLAINTSSIQLIPATAIAFLVANGGEHASIVIVSTLIATSFSTLIAIIAVRHLSKWSYFKIKQLRLPAIEMEAE